MREQLIEVLNGVSRDAGKHISEPLLSFCQTIYIEALDMAFKRQIAANRANAAKSTDLSRQKGIAQSSQNGLCYGMLARTIPLYGESVHRFVLLLDSLRDEFSPRTAVESALVENTAVALAANASMVSGKSWSGS